MSAEPDLTLVPVDPSAACPECARVVLVSLDAFGCARQFGSCPHMDHIERRDGALFVAFRRAD